VKMTDSSTQPTCATCRYFDSYATVPDERALGRCRAHAPVVLGTSDGYPTCWPETAAVDWCGEHQPRVTEPAENALPSTTEAAR
jgi:hypothetical protein